MRRIVLLTILLALGFWVAWPAYSGYRIHGALKDGNAAALGGLVDFDSLRSSLRPAVGAEVEKRLTDTIAKTGPGGAALGADISKQLLPSVVDGVLVALVTPENLIRFYRDGGAAKGAIERIVGEQMGKSGGLAGLGGLGGLIGGKKSPVTDVTDRPAGPAPGAPAAPASFGPGNVKSFAFNGPLQMSIGIARDAGAKDPDASADLSFTGSDWKLTGLRPRL